MRIYYAHCIAIYGKPQESRDLADLQALFPNDEIYNPNCVECAEGYKTSGMQFFEDLLQTMDAVVFRALPDGQIPAGIYKEVATAKKLSRPVLELPSCLSRRELTVEQTREYLSEAGQR